MRRIDGEKVKHYKMKWICFLFLPLVFSCNAKQESNELNPLEIDLSQSYLHLNDQVQEILQLNNGKFPILVYENQIENKQLVYLGEQHGNDPTNPRFDTIQKYFTQFKPQLVLNEGGQIADSVHYASREEAIKKNGTLGFLKYLTDQGNIPLKNADCSDRVEVASLLRKHNRGQVIYSFVCQRFIPQFIAENQNNSQLEAAYHEFTTGYLNKNCGFNLSDAESQWRYFENLYRQNNGNENIDLRNFDLRKSEYYLHEQGELGQIGRSSIHIRDSVILTNIYGALKNHDRVLIVFGAVHLLAQKPTLDKMFGKKSK